MQNSEIDKVIIFRFYSVHDKYDIIKIVIKSEKNRKYYRKCSNNFAAD